MKRARCFSGSHSSTEGGNKNPVCRSIERKLLIRRRPSSCENQLADSNAYRYRAPVKSDRLLGAEVEASAEVPSRTRNKLLELGRAGSSWQRVKHGGYRALD